jgi:hypothetical protein
MASPFRHRKKKRRRLRKSAKHWQALAAQQEDKKPELATGSILMGVPWLVPGIVTSTTVAVFVWRSTAKS